LTIEPGELVGLIGPNGAGKTTFIDAITGFVRYGGEVELGGARLDGLPPHARAQRGLARTWQTVELFDDLSVRENLTVATKGGSATSVDEELELLDLTAAAEAMPWELMQADASGPASAGRWWPGRGCSASTSRPPGWMRGRAASWAICCLASPVPGPRCCSSTTTWAWC
jgi:hypothetical protein